MLEPATVDQLPAVLGTRQKAAKLDVGAKQRVDVTETRRGSHDRDGQGQRGGVVNSGCHADQVGCCLGTDRDHSQISHLFNVGQRSDRLNRDGRLAR
jgi:hypothetical protein